MQRFGSDTQSLTPESLAAILDAVSEAVFVLDSNRRVLLSNRAAQELFGSVSVGQDLVRVIRQPECLRCVDAVLAGEKSAQTVITLSHQVETVCQIRVVAMDMTDGDAAGAIVSIDDISEIQEAERMRSDFVANVSHELRSPLTALSGFIETLQGAAHDDADARRHFLNVMESEAHRMDRLIDDLLSLSKVEINARVRPTERIDLQSVIQRVIATLSLQAEDRGKTVDLTLESNVSDVRGDRDELMQIFQNLIENAIKYSAAETSIEISLTQVDHAPGIAGPAVRVDVRDSGAGIPRSQIPRLTERFYRVDDGRGRSEGGTGLGLAIVKHIVSRHRGRLQIKSEAGVGSTFSVFLPVENANA